MKSSLKEYKSGAIGIKALKSSIELNARSLEMMPYHLAKQIDEIEAVKETAVPKTELKKKELKTEKK